MESSPKIDLLKKRFGFQGVESDDDIVTNLRQDASPEFA
jgi:hypothetical protein